MKRFLLVLLALAVVMTVLPVSALAQPPAPSIEYYHLDALGSVRAVTDYAGVVVRRHEILPFGEEWTEDGTPGPDEARLFTGKERDTETGLDYFGARYYRAGIGRFTSVDPELNVKEALVDPQRWNRYAYGRNNPLKYVDPDGRDVWLYTERISTQNAGWPGAILGVRHSVLRVQIGEAVDVTIEITASPDRLVVKPVQSILDVIGGRTGIETAWVERPDGMPRGDYRFEQAILAEVAVLGKNLPEYDYMNANCNAFARFLVEQAGGKVMSLPVTAGFSSRMDSFRRAYEEQLRKEKREKEKRENEDREKKRQ